MAQQGLRCARAMEFSPPESLLEEGQQLAAKQAAKPVHWQEEAGLACDPARVIQGQSARRNQAVQVGMVAQVLAPGMQDSQYPNVCSEMAWISRDLQQGLRGGAKQQVVEQALVAEGEGSKLLRQGEDDVGVRHW